MKKAIVLLSGGIDSAVTLYLARERGFRPTALIFDYGQRHRKEIIAAKKIAKKARTGQKIVKLRFPLAASALLDKNVRLPANRSFSEIKKGVPSTYVPARNLIFLSIAASFAESLKAHAIFIGAHSEDYSGYPDCRKGFFDAFQKAVTSGTKAGSRVRIYAPLVDKNKKEIIKAGLRLGVPFRLTWSCYAGEKTPCPRCDRCLYRERAFRELGIKDPYCK